MDKESFDQLIKVFPLEVKKRGVLLYNGVVSSAASYKQNASSANLKSWRASEGALDEFIGSLNNNRETESGVFKNRVAVVEYLKKNNIGIKKSKLYKDAESGKLRVQPDGSVLLSDVELYTRAYLTPRQKLTRSAEVETLQKERIEKENIKLDEQIAKLIWDREKEAGRYLLRSGFEMELAARAAVLQTSLQQMASSKSYEWIAVCKGDYNKTADLSAMITREIEGVLNDYASTDSFQVIFIDKSDKLEMEKGG